LQLGGESWLRVYKNLSVLSCRQKWAQEFRKWTINELNRMKAGRPNAATPVAVEPDERDEEMARMRKRMKYMARDLDIIAANSMFPD